MEIFKAVQFKKNGKKDNLMGELQRAMQAQHSGVHAYIIGKPLSK